MRVALWADIHGNLPALEAVLAQTKAEKPDLVLSLGDQVGFGPSQREVMERLAAEGIPCLRGNHEQRVLDLWAGEPFAGRSFGIFRRAAETLAGLDLTLPMFQQLPPEQGGLLCVHAAPDDTFISLHPRAPENTDVILAAGDAPLIAMGHRHCGYARVTNGRTAVIVGSVGMPENGVPGTAAYTMAEWTHGGWTLEPQLVCYDTAPLYGQFIKSGLAAADPIMARLVHQSMVTGQETILPFVSQAVTLTKGHGGTGIGDAEWGQVAEVFAWPSGPQSCAAYWGL